MNEAESREGNERFQRPGGLTDEEWQQHWESVGTTGAQEVQSENTSGTGTGPPPEVHALGWCWGGFTFNVLWSLANRAWLPAIAGLFPGIHLLVRFYLGFRGHRLAWRKRRFHSLDQYKEVMHIWNAWGLVGFIGYIIAALALIVIRTILPE